MTGIAEQRIRCVGAVIFDGAGRLLMVRRAHEPGQGRWSVPGGRVHPGETDAQAVIREVAEETGLVVEIIRLLGSVQRHAFAATVFDIYDYYCRITGGALRPGDDADDARWCDRQILATLPVVDGLIEALTDWHCLPPAADMSPHRGSGGSSGRGGTGAHG
jgi:ADP-ribose pyrophosphatase YjhB (NUDIX family)